MGKYTNYSDRVGVEAQSFTQLGSAHVVRKFSHSPSEVEGITQQHHVELSLKATSNPARACYVDFWERDNFHSFGDLFLIPAQQNVHIKSERQTQTAVVCCFDPNAMESWFNEQLEWNGLRLKNVLNINSHRIRSLLFQMSEEILKPGFASATIVELLSSQIAIELIRYVRECDSKKVRGGLAPWRLQIIDERIAEFSTQPTLSELAQLCHLSPRQLSRAFRISKGCTVGDYISKQRIERAKLLIAAGESVKAVAYSMGFSAPSNFTAAFVRLTGESPSQYRSRANHSQNDH